MAKNDSEVVFYESPEAVVTNTRAVLDGVTYAMANVTSVRMHKAEPSHVFPIVCLLFGGLLIIVALSQGNLRENWLWLMGGIFAVIVGGHLLITWEDTYTVVLGTSGGETHAISNQDKSKISPIVDAISKAIVTRG
jgi:hypothetical protein